MTPSASLTDPSNWGVVPSLLWWVFLGVAGTAIVGLTVWAYRGHREGSRRRILILLILRLLALVCALFTAGRPSATVEEKPNVPSRLLIGIDLSRSMTVPDEAGGQARIAAVRARLAECQPILDELARQNCEVTLYAFGPSEFTPATGQYDPTAPAAGERSDYAAYLRKTADKWAGEPYVRGHLIIGDGADNGPGTLDGKKFGPSDAAPAWKKIAPLSTFAVGDPGTTADSKDVAFADVVMDPDPVAIKNKFVVRARVNAVKMSGIKVPVVIQWDLDGKGYVTHLTSDLQLLAKESNNLLEIPVEAPPELPTGSDGQPRRQIKVRVEIPMANCPGDTNERNNAVETFLNLNKEGLRVLVVSRFNYEYPQLLDALTADKRIDVRKVDLQTDEGGEGLKEAFDFDKQGYDVVVFGNVSPKQITAIDPALPAKLAARVKDKGMGFMMVGGFATLNGTAGGEAGWRGVKEVEDILPVALKPPAPPEPETAKFMVVPQPQFADHYLVRLADTRADSLFQWNRLNTPKPSAHLSALNRIDPKDVKPGSSVYLWAKDSDTLIDLDSPPADARQYPLLVGTQLGADTKSRVLVFAGIDSSNWRRLDIKTTQDGKKLYSRFWRQTVLWLAKQDQEEANAFARPEFPRVRVNQTQGIKVGFRGPTGAAADNPTYELRVSAPGDPADAGAVVPVGTGPSGEPRAEYRPTTPGEYTVSLKASGTVNGEVKTGEATAKFIVTEDVSEEMQRTTPDHPLLRSIAAAGGGKFNRLEDLPAFLTELKNQPMVTEQPKTKKLPDWTPKPTNGFLPVWMLVFAALLVAEWGLRRWWGLV